MAKKKSIHYVDNKKFHEEMVLYKNHCADVKKKDPDSLVPIIPDYIGDCFMRIAERLSLRPNFVLKIVFNLLIILIQKNHLILFHISHKSFITLL